MNGDLLIGTREIGNHRIKIYYDINSLCPCTDWDMAACFLWEYGRTDRLSDECNWREVFGKYGDNRHSLADALRQLISDHVEWKDLLDYLKNGRIDGYRMRYDEPGNIWFLEWYCNSRYSERKGYQEIFSASPSELDTYDYTDVLIESLEYDEMIQILNDLGKGIFVKEWSSMGHCQGDYVEGVAFCKKERYAQMVSTDTTDWKIHIDALIDNEVKCIGMWMWGDVKGYVLEKKVPYTKHYQDSNREDEEGFDWEEIDSCWGFFMETEDLIEEIIAERELKDVA